MGSAKSVVARRWSRLTAARPHDEGPPPPTAIPAQRIDEQDMIDSPAEQDNTRFDRGKRGPWSAEADGSSMHAGVLMRAGHRVGHWLIGDFGGSGSVPRRWRHLPDVPFPPALWAPQLSVQPSGGGR